MSKHLTYKELEEVASDSSLIKGIFYKMHLKSCEECQSKLQEVKENLELQNELEPKKSES